MSNSVLAAVLGYGVILAGPAAALAMAVSSRRKAKKRKAASIEAAAVPAPGSAGQLKLHNVQPRAAAVLMAIVADHLGKPLNELRFISIQEVNKDEI